jgi:YD repeat-containing protein
MDTFQTPRLHTSEYGYDALGRLASAKDASAQVPNPNPAKTLVSATNDTGRAVTYTSAVGRVTTYTVEQLAAGGTQLVDTSPANLTETTIVPSTGVRVTTFPDGETDTFEMRPDFRFGLQAPVFTRTIRMPSGSALTRQITRTGTLNANNTLDLATATESVVVNGRTPAFQRTYLKSGSTRTITSTSAERL